MIRRIFQFFVISTVILLLLVITGVGGFLYYQVAVHPGPEIDHHFIEQILARESPVYYQDGSHKLGVLFQGIHRQYLSYEQIPKTFVNAIVAAEDDNFFHHHGIDIRGIIRALIVNIRAGRVVQGGSTITQQTAKNLFKRESRSYRAKFRELLWALRLEYYYPKEKILEFYINQFFVSGNGHGLGVAARYYFNKSPQELTLLEAAFIAGSVKRPNYYNPFTKKRPEQAQLARQRARERADYVLGKMRRLGMISQAEYAGAMAASLDFQRGKMSYAINSIMDQVRSQLASGAITDSLEDHGISNIATSGVRIITTVDYGLQQECLYTLRRALSVLDVQLRGYNRREVQQQYQKLSYHGDSRVALHAFLMGKIAAIQRQEPSGMKLDQAAGKLSVRKTETAVRIRVHFGKNQPDGIIDRKGFDHLLPALAQFSRNRWSKAKAADFQKLQSQLRVGDQVFVSVREMQDDGQVFLDLERYPKVQGAALITRMNGIVAMAGGLGNRFFNRALDARRLMGSTFKPFLFGAALQLGWNSVDLLDNRRHVFVFMDKPYFPRPDHHSPHQFVSMSWAGVNSENVAAVWLLYHLLDRLSPPRLRELAAHMDMAPRVLGQGQESYASFKRRIRDQFGIRVNNDVLDQAAYDRAVDSLEADFLFDNRARDYRQLRELPYGLHFADYRQEIELALENATLKKKQRDELKLRHSLLWKSFLDLKPVYADLTHQRRSLTAELANRSFFSIFRQTPRVQPGRGRFVRDQKGRIIFTWRQRLPPDWHLLHLEEVADLVADIDPARRAAFWDAVQVEGAVSAYALEQVTAQFQEERRHLATLRPYSMEVLATVRDYRVMLGLQYLIKLGHRCGIVSKLEPVLSFPLGSNVVTLADMVRLYTSLVKGQCMLGNNGSNPFGGSRQSHELAVIDRIETPEGKIVYQRKLEARPTFDPRIAAAVGNILENVVAHGTGRYAHEHLRMRIASPETGREAAPLLLPVPCMGKTGTANKFRNAAFIGVVPVASGSSAVSVAQGYTVGTYVGYDTNEPMIRGTLRVTGSVGALPMWTRLAQVLLHEKGGEDKLDPVDLTFNGLALAYPSLGEVFLPVDPASGGVVRAGARSIRSTVSPARPAILTFGKQEGRDGFVPERFFLPYWRTPTRENGP